MKGEAKQDLLQVLRGELAFLEAGGYRRPQKAHWRPQYIFQDSPTCINYGDLARSRPCEECPLMQFVPENCRREKVPCRHIPLNEQGETVNSLYRSDSMEEVEAEVAKWLRATIARLEAEKGEKHLCAQAQSA